MQRQDKVKIKILKGSRMSRRVRQKLGKPNLLGDLCINEENWDTLNLDEQLIKLSEWNIPYGLLMQCNCSSILKSINSINFMTIKKLSLRYNRIQSLEPLCRIYMPSLQKLLISNNWILNMNSLRKIDLPNLEVLQIDRNLGKEMNRLSEMNLPKLRKINTDRPDKYSGIQWIFKIEAQLSIIQISSFKRIQQPQQTIHLYSKFPNLKILKNWD